VVVVLRLVVVEETEVVVNDTVLVVLVSLVVVEETDVVVLV